MNYSGQKLKGYRILILLFFIALFSTACMGDRSNANEQKEFNNQTDDTTWISIQPLSYSEDSIAEIIRRNIEIFYGFKAEILSEKPLPSSAYYSPRNRYRADSLIQYLAREKTDKFDHIIGVTSKDISCTKGQYQDWGIFGLGYMPGPSCVVSTFRLKRGNPTTALFRERVIKVALHELGHNLGLPHCPTKDCMMQDAEGTIVTVDAEKMELCSSCKERIGKN